MGLTNAALANAVTAGQLLRWECGELHTAMRSQHGAQRERPAVLEGLRWAIPCGERLTVTAAGLQHRVPCWGYVFAEHDLPAGLDEQRIQVCFCCSQFLSFVDVQGKLCC